MATYQPPLYYQPQQSPMIWVQGPQQVDTYPVQYGGTVVLWDKEQPIIYIKSVDNFGNPSVQILDYTFRKNQAPVIQVRNGCCLSTAVRSVSASNDPTVIPASVINVQNGNLVIDRIA